MQDFRRKIRYCYLLTFTKETRMTFKTLPSKKELTAKAHDAGTKVRALYDHASDEVHDLAHTVEGHIQKKPVQASLIALGAGLVLGLLLRRR